jgi:ubiquinone/menaquinone biosynthesis C-methylase UbiE
MNELYAPKDSSITETKEFYDNCSIDYDNLRNSTAYQKLTTIWEREFIAERITGGSTLEIGCGTGRITETLLSKKLELTVADQSEAMLGILRKKFPDGNFRAVCSDIFKLEANFPHGSFDAVVSMRVIPHIDDMPEALKIISSILKPEGVFIFDMWNSLSYPYLRRRVADVVFSRREKVFTRFLPLPRIFSLVAGAGLNVENWAGWGFPQVPGYPLELFRHTPFKCVGKTIMLHCRKPR